MNDAGGSYTYSLNGANINITNNIIPGLNVGCYLLTITDGNGCIAWANITIGSPAYACCNVSTIDANELIVFNAPTANTFSNYFGGSSIANKKIYCVGNVTIDASIAFVNCTIYFSPNAIVNVVNGSSLSFSNCHLLASCNELWDGIYSSDPSCSISFTNNCILENMLNGVVSSYGAKIVSQNTLFVDNNIGIQFKNTPLGFVTGTNGNKGVVKNSTFTSSGNFLLPPLSHQPNGECGIKIHKCEELQLGELINGSVNSFSQIETGVFVEPWFQEVTSTWPYQIINHYGTIQLFNSRFEDIRNDEVPEISDKLTQLYTERKGAAIFINQHDYSNNISFEISNSSQFLAIKNCDKGIVNSNVNFIADHILMKDVFAGFSNVANGRSVSINHSGIQNTLLGIQVLGQPSQLQIIQNNTSYGGIRLLETPYPPGLSTTFEFTPTGIDVQNYNSSAPNDYSIEQNDIIIDGKIGIGISANTTGMGTSINGNTVLFSQTTTIPQNSPVRTNLTAIQSIRGEGNSISCNMVYGISPTVFGQYNTTALKLHQTKNALLECNQNNWTRFGITATGHCPTATGNIKSNTMNNHMYGFATLPSVTSEGDVGDIGLTTQDNNNRFLGLYTNSNGYRTFRYWSAGAAVNQNSQRRIYTNLNYSNGSNNSSLYASYQLTSAVNPQDCQELDGCFNDDHIPSLTMPFGIPEAVLIAEEQINFANFPEVSQWIAQHELYAELDENSALRSSNSILYTFYEEQEFEPLGKFLDVERLINDLKTAEVQNSAIEFASILSQAKTINNSINSTKVYETNLKWINDKQLTILEFGWQSIGATNKDQINSLAHSCPAIDGIGVYKARFLNTYTNPIITYNDYTICAPQGKGGMGFYDEFYSFINGEEGNPPTENYLTTTIKDIQVYPIPAIDHLSVKCNLGLLETGVFTLYDMAGQVLLRTEVGLNGELNNVQLVNLSTGIYQYTVTTSTRKFTGKLNILQ